MNRYSWLFIFYLLLWLVLALTPAFLVVFRDGGPSDILGNLGGLLANAPGRGAGP